MAEASSMKDIEAYASRLGVDLSSIDLDSIHLPPDDNMGIASDDEDIVSEDNLELEIGFGNIIVVDNLPIVRKEKIEKLKGVIHKLYSQIGVVKDDSIWMPVDPDNEETLGYCFIEYKTNQEAELAKEKTHGYKLDRTHTFSVNMFDDIDKFMNVPDHWTPPETKPYVPGENLQHWLTDPQARDQFVIRAGSNTEVLWNDARNLKPVAVYNRRFTTVSSVQWSPLGTYLTTVHRQGAAVWGGATTFNRLMCYSHPQVQLIDFSPGEKYLVTYSNHEPINPQDTNRTGKLMRDFKGSADDFAIGGGCGVPRVLSPIFKWSNGRDDKYFARMGKNVLSVYETDTFSLIGKKSLKVENIRDFSWSPTDPIIALFVPEKGSGNQPARVSLIQIPSKEELRQKILFSVSDCKMYWQSNGDYLAVHVDRFTKSKKNTYTGFELFYIKERNMPIEVLELETKSDKIISFAWEPKGHRFTVIHGNKPNVSIYSTETGQHSGRISKLTTLKGKKANALFWSPAGRFIVLAGLKGFNGQLEFYDVDELQTIATREHFMATDVEWDPSGRYVATAVTSVHEMENGFNVWSFAGNHLYRILKDHFFQFLWRPRPPSVLSAEKEEEILKNLEKYSKKYEAEDEDVSLQLSEQEREKRRLLKEDWEKWVTEWKGLHEEERLLRESLRDGVASNEDEEEEYETKDIEVEEVINVTEEVIQD